jgi:hypothetical protein
MREQRNEARSSNEKRAPPSRERSSRGARGVSVIETAAEITTVSVVDELVRLEALDPEALRRRWRAVMGHDAPPSVPKFLLLRVLAYRLQADAGGDLDLETRKYLAGVADELVSQKNPDRSGKVSSGPASLTAIGLPDLRPGRLQLGSVLVREHGGIVHHVMVLADGFAWKGRTYASLSTVALAITGTVWNGRRFFGVDLRAKQPRKAIGLQAHSSAANGGSR